MLEALYESGIVPDVLVGTSPGALNAAFIASRPQTRERSAIRIGRDVDGVAVSSLGSRIVGLPASADSC